jgi:hypothetical protein
MDQSLETDTSSSDQEIPGRHLFNLEDSLPYAQETSTGDIQSHLNPAHTPHLI